MQMYLSLVLAMERLSKAALAKSRETKEKVITERHIKLIFKVSKNFLHAVQVAYYYNYAVMSYMYL